MSYIRCLSNPESLYIFDSRHVEVWPGRDDKNNMHIPSRIFCHVLEKSFIDGPDLIRYGGVRVEEVFINHKPPKLLFPPHKKLGYRGDFKIRLSYKGRHIDMWNVTWDYIVNGYIWSQYRLYKYLYPKIKRCWRDEKRAKRRKRV